MTAGQIQKPGTQAAINKPVEAKASAVNLADEDLVNDQENVENEDVETETPVRKKTDPKKPMDKVQKRAKGVKLSPIDVVATQDGYYANRRIKPGEKFKLDDESDFSHNWMKKII